MASINIERATIRNNFFRQVVWTTIHQQLVLMSIPPGQDIGLEVHPENDQFIRIERGTGLAVLGDDTIKIVDGDAITVPQGTKHNVINTGNQDLKLYTIYSPPHEDPRLIQQLKE